MIQNLQKIQAKEIIKSKKNIIILKYRLNSLIEHVIIEKGNISELSISKDNSISILSNQEIWKEKNKEDSNSFIEKLNKLINKKKPKKKKLNDNKENNKNEDYNDKEIDENISLIKTTQIQYMNYNNNIYNNPNNKLNNEKIKFLPMMNNININNTNYTSNINYQNKTNIIFPNNTNIYKYPPLITFKNIKKNNKIKIDDIIIGNEKRTTLMLRNIPNKYTLNNILEEINSSFWGKFDYINLPIDYERKLNLGYAFINFVNPFHIILFYETYYLKKWSKYKSEKKIDMTYADKQGKKDINLKDEQTYFAIDDKRFNFYHIHPKIEIPISYLDFFKKIYPNSVCVVKDKHGIYNDKFFEVKNLGKK